MKLETLPPDIHLGKRPIMSPDEWAELCVSRVMMVSDTAPEPIRSQAYGYREQIRKVIARTIQQALEADRASVTTRIITEL